MTTGFQHSSRSTGFSLVELVVVVFVLGTIAAIAAPRFGYASSSYRLESAVKKIETDLDFALRTARARSTTIEFSFDPDTDRYTLVGVRDPQNPKIDLSVDLSELPYGVDISDVRFSGADSKVLVITGHGTFVNQGVVRIGLGSNARLIALGGSGSIEARRIKSIPVPPARDAPSIDLVTPHDFGK